VTNPITTAALPFIVAVEARIGAARAEIATASANLASLKDWLVALPDEPIEDPDDPPEDPPTDPPVTGRLPALTRAYIDSLPKSGAAYEAVVSRAKNPGRPDLSNQDSIGSANILARGLLGDQAGVAADLAAAAASLPKVSRVLSLARESQPLALAAALTGHETSVLLWDILTKTGLESRSIGKNLREHAALDPTNWGCHSRATLAWAPIVLSGGSFVLDEAVDALTRYLTTGAGFSYKKGDGDDPDQQAWQPDPAHLVCIGPKGATRNGIDLDGCITNDAYRGGGLASKLTGDGANYVPEGFQGTVSAAIALDMQGHPLWDIGDRAILRTALWSYRMGAPFTGDDAWMGWVLKRVYGAAWPHPLAANPAPGKGWGVGVDWLYG
jgi:hypothetical protein